MMRRITPLVHPIEWASPWTRSMAIVSPTLIQASMCPWMALTWTAVKRGGMGEMVRTIGIDTINTTRLYEPSCFCYLTVLQLLPNYEQSRSDRSTLLLLPYYEPLRFVKNTGTGINHSFFYEQFRVLNAVNISLDRE
jgi:hypothetical protein